MRTTPIIAVIIIIAVLLLFTLSETAFLVRDSPILDNLVEKEVKTYYTSVEITDLPEGERILLGLNADKGNLSFGIVPRLGVKSKRFIELQNTEDMPVLISFQVSGNIKSYVEFDQNEFILNKNENKTVEISLHAKNATPGNYTGEIDIIIVKRKFNL